MSKKTLSKTENSPREEPFIFMRKSPEAQVAIAMTPKPWTKRDDVEKIAIRRRLLAEFNAGHNAKQAAENVCDIFGEDTLKHVTCQRWFQKFRKGNTALSDGSMGGLFFEWADPTPTFENMFRQAELLEKNVMKAYNAKKNK
ncbi:histone-lysine N-methyltransferase SETMAR-like [Ditylenchus destructor]|nr:histone-lysine N-methyltransferase SETMAR-like [Ditylenchus destructor]